MLPAVSVAAARTYCTTAPFVAGVLPSPLLSGSSSDVHESWQYPAVVLAAAQVAVPNTIRVSPSAVPFPASVTLLVGNVPSLTPPVVIPKREPLEVRYSAFA